MLAVIFFVGPSWCTNPPHFLRAVMSSSHSFLGTDDLVLHIYMTVVHREPKFMDIPIYLHHIFGLLTFPFFTVSSMAAFALDVPTLIFSQARKQWVD